MENVFIEGLSTTIVGMLIVFVILIALSVVLYLLKFSNPEYRKGNPENVEINSNNQIEHIIETIQLVEPINNTNDLELIAVITAVIATSLGTTSEKLQVKSIKRVQNWNTVSRREQQRSII